MAYWTIDFMTRAGRPIHIRIGGKSGSTNVALTPSDNPCVIEEEGKENLFIPVKTQSGYVEVITDSVDLAAEIIPTKGASRNVFIYETATPTSETVPLWAGYVQPKLLKFKLWNGKQRLQIPIECRLSGLKYEPILLPSANTVSIGALLYRILATFDYAYFQGGMVVEGNGEAGDKERAWLRKKVYTSLLRENYTMYDILEHICTFFGWTCRQHGISAYFIANRNVDGVNDKIWRILTTGLTPSASGTYSSVNPLWAEVMLSGNMLAGTANNVKFTEGCRLAKASCSLVTFDQDTDVDFKEIGIAIDDGDIAPTNSGTTHEWSSGGHYYEEVTNNFWTEFGDQTPVEIGDFTATGYNIEPKLEKNGSSDVQEWTAELVVWYKSHYKTDTFWSDSGDPESPGHWDTIVTIYEQYFGYLTLETAAEVDFSTKGTLVVKAKTDTDYNRYRGACFFVKVGDLWYNPINSAWQSAKPSTYIKIEPDNDDGYSIPVSNAMTGKLTIQFVPDKDDINKYRYTSQSYALKSVSAEFTAEQSETYNSQISNVEFSTSNGAGFDKEVSFDSLLCIRGELQARSKNFLLDADDGICAGLYDTPYSDAGIFSPLQRLCDQAAAEMSKVGRMYEIIARWRGGLTYDITPLTMIYIEPIAEWCYPVSAKYNIRDDEVVMRMVRRNYSEENY